MSSPELEVGPEDPTFAAPYQARLYNSTLKQKPVVGMHSSYSNKNIETAQQLDFLDDSLLGLDKICLANFEQNGQPKERSNSASKMGCQFCQKSKMGKE